MKIIEIENCSDCPYFSNNMQEYLMGYDYKIKCRKLGESITAQDGTGMYLRRDSRAFWFDCPLPDKQ